MTNAVTTKSTLKNIHIMAGSPAEMELAQKGLIDWCRAKMDECKALKHEAERTLKVAKQNAISTQRFQSRVRKHNQKLTYYSKIRAALEAGYYIIPPFPNVQLFAIRTDKKKPPRGVKKWPSSLHQKPQLLQPGDGRFVSDWPENHRWEETETNASGNENKAARFQALEFKEVDFPFTLVKPEVIEATGKALKEKIFDQIGLIPARGCGDPIVVGQIKRPGAPHYHEPTTFFVAWWLDTADLG